MRLDLWACLEDFKILDRFLLHTFSLLMMCWPSFKSRKNNGIYCITYFLGFLMHLVWFQMVENTSWSTLLMTWRKSSTLMGSLGLTSPTWKMVSLIWVSDWNQTNTNLLVGTGFWTNLKTNSLYGCTIGSQWVVDIFWWNLYYNN